MMQPNEAHETDARSPLGSNEDTENEERFSPARWLPIVGLWLMGAAAMVVAGELLTRGGKVMKGGIPSSVGPLATTTPRPPEGACKGYDSCPPYPKPYYHNEWPQTYDYSGKFPSGFVWGMGTAAYQIEGGYREGGRGVSIWDTFTGANTLGMPGSDCSYCCKELPCQVNDKMIDRGATGNVAADHYHMYETDVALMKSMGLQHYRFSISWTRIFPTGWSAKGINQEGVDFYNRLIDRLLAANITPWVTLYHWDLPQGLLSPPRAQGWWSRDEDTGEPDGQIADEFVAYADACFKAFGDRVKKWVTFNEAWTFTYLGSQYGKAPCIPEYGNMSTDPYIAGHNVLNAHARVVDLYRTKYKPTQGGIIGITNNCDWREPKTPDPADVAAAKRAVEFQLGWFADPIFSGTGDYPAPMRRLFGDRLPKFTEEQKRLLNGSADFFGLNHYGTAWVEYDPNATASDMSYAALSFEGLPQAQSKWLYGGAWGFRKILNWVKQRYNNPPIYVTEGGWSLEADSAEEGAVDFQRLMYYANYTSEMRKAIDEDSVDVRGYFAWSLLDNFEWERGYVERFGTVFTEYGFGYDKNSPEPDNKNRPTVGQQFRRVKESNCWLQAVWAANSMLSLDSGGCPSAGIFDRSYTDPNHPGCPRSISIIRGSENATIEGADASTDSTGCDHGNSEPWGPVPAFVSGGSILANFSLIGGNPRLAGFWDITGRRIVWADGMIWHDKAAE